MLQLIRPSYYVRCLKEVLDFLFQPRLTESSRYSIPEKLRDVFVLLILTLLFSLTAYYLTRFYFKPPLRISAFRFEEQFGELGLFVFIVLLIPFLEECMYRLPMKYTAANFSIALSLLSFDLISRFLFQTIKYQMDDSLLTRLLFALTCGFVFYLIQTLKPVQNALRKLWASQFTGVFYFLSCSFALIHILNFQYSLIPIYLWPLITLPQLFLGFTTGFVRLRCGFYYGFLLHALYNSSYFWLPILF